MIYITNFFQYLRNNFLIKSLLFFLIANQTYGLTQEKPFVIAICSYNNSTYYQENLDSALSQNYSNFRILYIDDASTDGTGENVEHYIKDNHLEHKIHLIKNTQRKRQLANHHTIIHKCDDQEIIVVLDGDDRFSNENVLSYLNEIYTNEDIWMTYGSHIDVPTNKKPYWVIPLDPTKLTRGYREHPWVFEHVRSYYAWLAKCVKLKDLIVSTPLPRKQLKIYIGHTLGSYAFNNEPIYNQAINEMKNLRGKFFPAASDPALMLPMAEMAYDRIKFIPEILYHRNVQNPLNTVKTNYLKHRYSWSHIVASTPYQRLQSPILNKNTPEETDVIIFANSLKKLLDTVRVIKKKVKGAKKIYGFAPYISNSYLKVFLNQLHLLDVKILSSSKNFIENLSSITKNASNFILFCDDKTHIDKTIDLLNCTKLLKQTDAHAFYLDNIEKTNIPPHEKLENNVYFWKFTFGGKHWFKPHNFKWTLYRKTTIIQALKNYSRRESKYFKNYWAGIQPPKNDIGLFLL